MAPPGVEATSARRAAMAGEAHNRVRDRRTPSNRAFRAFGVVYQSTDDCRASVAGRRQPFTAHAVCHLIRDRFAPPDVRQMALIT